MIFEQNTTECPKHYKTLLSLRERLNVEIRASLDKLALLLNSADDITITNWFKVSEDLFRRNRTLLGLLPEDFDEVLMKSGDDYAPSKRLNDIANQFYNEEEDVSRGIPGSILKSYFKQYFTYKAVYKKLTKIKNLQTEERKPETDRAA